MKLSRLILLTTLLTYGISNNSFSQEKGFGIGIMIGEPTGFNLKSWLNSTSALDAGLAWSFVKESSFHIHADYLLHAFDVFKLHEKMPLYYGIGGRIKVERHAHIRLGLRLVVGVNYIFSNAPIDLFLEIAPILDIAPATELRGNAAIGGRFFFQ